MVISLLSYLIDIHELSVNDLSKKCGISRPALTALVNNTGKGIQFDTISKLCKFFHIGVSDLLLLIDESTCGADIETYSFDTSGKKIVCDAEIKIGSRKIKGECIAWFNGNCIEAELRTGVGNSYYTDDISYIGAITNSPEASRLLTSILEKSVEDAFSDYKEYDIEPLVWL